MWVKSVLKGVIATFVAIAALTSAPAEADSKLSLSKVKVAMPYTILVQRAALEAAMQGGEFEKEGLEVEIVQFRSWTEPVQAIAGNAAHFAFGGASFLRAVVGHNAPVRAITLVSSRMPYAFYVKKGSGINSIADLKGKTIQTVRTGETLDNVWKQMLERAGLTMTDVKRIESFNGFGTLASGNADVANLSSTWIGKARQAGFVQLIDYNVWRAEQGLPTEPAANLGWGTSLKMLKEHPDTVKAFLRGLARGTVRLKNDRAFAISVLTAKPYAMDEQTANEVYDLHRDHWKLRLDPSRGDYAFDAEMSEIVLGKPKGSIDVSTVIVPGPLNEALNELNIQF